MATLASSLRHPRYSIFILVSLIATLYLLFVRHEQQAYPFHLKDDGLGARVHRSHTIYDKFLVQRKVLLEKWGPEPKDIAL